MYALLGSLGLSVALALALAFSHQKIDTLEAEKQVLTEQLSSAARANERSQNAIAECEAVNAANAEARNKLEADIINSQNEIAALQAALAIEEDHIFEDLEDLTNETDDTCRTLLDPLPESLLDWVYGNR